VEGLKAVADTGPLVAAADRRDRAHALAASLVNELARELLVPDTVLVEADHLMRRRLGSHVARSFLSSAAAGGFSVAYLTPGLLREAVEIDARYAGVDLGFVDASVMAVAAREDLPIFTFDFQDFRAAPRADGEPWKLLLDEAAFERLAPR